MIAYFLGGCAIYGIVLFVLPGLLYLFDSFIQRTTWNTHFYKKPKEMVFSERN